MDSPCLFGVAFDVLADVPCCEVKRVEKDGQSTPMTRCVWIPYKMARRNPSAWPTHRDCRQESETMRSSTTAASARLPELSVEELSAAREILESQGFWVLTHRQFVYRLTRDAEASRQLTACQNFSRLGELVKARLLRTLLADNVPQQQQEEKLDRSRWQQLAELERCLRRYGVLNQLTRHLEPIGKLRSASQDDLRNALTDLATGSTDVHLASVAGRQLRRLTAQTRTECRTAAEYADGNLAVFPLDSELLPDSLRQEVHSEKRRQFKFENDDNNNKNSNSLRDEAATSCLKKKGCLLRRRQLEFAPHPLPDSEIYRPFLNDWTPFDMSPPSYDADRLLAEQTDSEHQLMLRQRLLASVVNSLTWRQKQLRQQKLAVRLATRSALIGLKHCITAQPAKNYLELYVNMISRAVEAASLHVRRWSHNLEQSWKTFRELCHR